MAGTEMLGLLKLASAIKSAEYEDSVRLRELAETLREMQGRAPSPYQFGRPNIPDFRNNRDLMDRVRAGNLFDQGLVFDPYSDMHIQNIGLYPIRPSDIYGG
jgi:hypothetical protein